MTVYFSRLDRVHRFAVTTQNDVLEVTNLFDMDGDEIDESDTQTEAMSAVVKVTEDRWASLRLDDWQQPTVH